MASVCLVIISFKVMVSMQKSWIPDVVISELDILSLFEFVLVRLFSKTEVLFALYMPLVQNAFHGSSSGQWSGKAILARLMH